MDDVKILASQDGVVVAEVIVAAMVTAYQHGYPSHCRENGMETFNMNNVHLNNEDTCPCSPNTSQLYIYTHTNKS